MKPWQREIVGLVRDMLIRTAERIDDSDDALYVAEGLAIAGTLCELTAVAIATGSAPPPGLVAFFDQLRPEYTDGAKEALASLSARLLQ